jgi:hypothetical protein
MKRKEHFLMVPPSNKRDLRNFGLLMGMILGLIAIYLWYRTSGVWVYLGGVAGIFLTIGLILPIALRPIYVVWMLLARLLAFVNTHILLALVFYTMFLLIGVVMRLLRYDPLDRQLDSKRQSYWDRRADTLLARDHYERQF